MKIVFLPILSILLLSGCGAVRESPKYRLSDDTYELKQKGFRTQKVVVYVEDDTLKVFSKENQPIVLTSDKDQFFLKRSFDVDVMTILFRYRPATANLPRQLTTDFNGNVFFGYRTDRFRIKYKKTPVGLRHSNSHKGITMGIFGGMGSTSVTPWTTDNKITDEYNGLVLSRGFAIMAAANNLTVGVGVGWDYLTDRDKNIWIYQNKPWYGLTIGLNLN